MTTSRGVIYALIDGRGSGYQGDKMLQEIYRRMGTVEIEDQIKVTKYVTCALTQLQRLAKRLSDLGT